MKTALVLAAFGFTFLFISARPASADAPSPAVAKQCSDEAAQKGLSQAARSHYEATCADRIASSDKSVTIKGIGSDKVSDADKQKLIYCGEVAANRHLSGDSFNHFMHDCLARQ